MAIPKKPTAIRVKRLIKQLKLAIKATSPAKLRKSFFFNSSWLITATAKPTTNMAIPILT